MCLCPYEIIEQHWFEQQASLCCEDDVDIMVHKKHDEDVPPSCYGMMIWILEYPEDSMHAKVTCDCNHKVRCLELTKKRAP